MPATQLKFRAGLIQTDSIVLTGVPLSVTRHLLKDAENPDAAADWQGVDASVWNDLLSRRDFDCEPLHISIICI